MSQMSHVSQMAHISLVSQMSQVFQMSHVSPISHVSQMSHKCVPNAPNVPSVPYVPSVPNFPNAPCVLNVQCGPNGSSVPCAPNVPYVPNFTCVQKNKAPQIMIDHISAMANINHMGDQSHLLWLPLCTQRWGHVGLPLSSQCILSVYLSHSFLSVCPALSIEQAVKHETLTQCWANIGPPFTILSQHLPSIGLLCRVSRHVECGPTSQTAGQH